MSLIKPLQKDDDLINDIKNTVSDAKSFSFWWLGQSGFLIKYLNKYLLFDPYLSDSLTKKYEKTEKPHTRMTELVVDPAKLNFINIVTSTHNHTDHLDRETLIPLFENNEDLNMIIPEANRDFIAKRLGLDGSIFVGLNDGNSVDLKGFKITGIPAAHNELARDEKGQCMYMGYVAEFGNFKVYHSGDTLWHEDILEALTIFDIDVAFLPINGNDPKRKVAGNLNTKEAAEFGKRLGIKLVVPCHYDMFTFNTANPKYFVKEAEVVGQRYRVMKCGEGVRFQ